MENLKIHVVGGDFKYGHWLSNNLVQSINDADLVIFTGGSDVHPMFYGEDVHPTTRHNLNRDTKEMAVYSECRSLKKPMLGICRGAQFLSAMNGCKIIQDVNNHAVYEGHGVKMLDSGNVFEVTSTHHQMINPFGLKDNEYNLLGVSSKKRSNVYSGGNYNYSDSQVPYETEVIYFPKTNCLCLQFHPEYMNPNSEAVCVSKELIIKKLLYV